MSSISQLSQKIPFSSKRIIWAQFAPKLFGLISHDLPQSLFWNIFSMMGHNRLTNFALVSFPQGSSFNTTVQFGHNLGEIHTTLCPRQLCLMIHSLNILKYGMMGYNNYTKVTVNLPKIFPFWATAIWAEFWSKLCNVMSRDSLSEDLFEVLWHDEAQYR